MNNAAKHSGATRISVVLLRAANHVEAIIEDNGRGLDPATRLQSKDGHGRLGLVGMEERLSGIGGSLHIESGPGSGTTLIVRIPLVRRA